jgi:hypothetical protein
MSALLQIGLSYILDHDPQASNDKLELLESGLTAFLSGTKPAAEISQLFRDTLGSTKPFDRIATIVQTSDKPIPDFSMFCVANPRSGRRTRAWTHYENQRLLAGIHRFGTDDWLAVARFVGNGRTRAQCSQRWLRGLDPRICRDRWTPKEENRLQELVECFGTRSWTKVAGEMGNRSDVQCRYHYNQMRPEGPAISASASMPSGVVLARVAQGEGKTMLPSIRELLNTGNAFKPSASMSALPTFVREFNV